MNIKSSLILIFLVLLVSCGNSKAKTMQQKTILELSGTYVVTILGENNSLIIHPEITFDTITNGVSGFSGCNRFSGSYILEGSTLTFSPLASTKMLCQEVANTIEHNLFEVLSQVNSFSLHNNELILLKDKTVLLVAKQNNDYVIEYTALSRGMYEQIIITDSKITFQKNRESKPITKITSKTDWIKLRSLLKKIDIKAIPKLEPPSKAHQYDGAAIANLKITYNGKDYETQSFDHENPPKEIEALVKEILSMAQNIE